MKKIAYNPGGRVSLNWKRYEGINAPDIWIFDLIAWNHRISRIIHAPMQIRCSMATGSIFFPTGHGKQAYYMGL